MVLSGLTFSRAIFRAASTLLIVLASLAAGRAQSGDLAGTMPEDYLPQLKEILEVARQRSPQLIAADYERAAREAGIYLANSARLPSLRGNAEFASNQTAASGNNSSSSRASGFFYRFDASQALFHWGALRNQSRAAEISLLVAQKNFALATRELSVELRKAYLALVVEKAALRQMREAVATARNDLNVMDQKKRTGSISGAAFATEGLRVRELELETSRDEAEFAVNRQRLARMAGLPGMDLPEDRIADDMARPAYPAELATAMTATLLREGAKSTLEYEVHDLRVREATLRHRIEKTRLLPKFFAGAGYSLENNTDVNANSVNQQAYQRQAVNISMQWAIFDGLATRGAIREALAAKRVHERTLIARTDETLRQAQALERMLKVDAEQVDLAELRHGMAVEGQKRIATEVKVGNVPKNNLSRANLAILQARAKSFEARALFLGRWSEFVAATSSDPILPVTLAGYAPEKK